MTDNSDILMLLGSLVSNIRSEDETIVKLAHITLYEFFTSEALRTHESLSKFVISYPAIFEAGVTCCQYLSFTDFGQPCKSKSELDERLASYKFLKFAATHWVELIRVANGSRTRGILPAIRWFLEPCHDDKRNFISWQQVYHGTVDSSKFPLDPLSYAVEFDLIHLFDILLQRGASPEALYRKGYSDLHIAAIRGHETELARALQMQPKLKAPVPDIDGEISLHLAARYGHTGVVKLLLEAGVSPHPRVPSPHTPFYFAMQSGEISTIEVLYAAGCDINARDRRGLAPIFEAIFGSHVEVAQWLVQRGAKLDIEYSNFGSVLDFARKMGNKDIIKIIEEGLARTT